MYIVRESTGLPEITAFLVDQKTNLGAGQLTLTVHMKKFKISLASYTIAGLLSENVHEPRPNISGLARATVISLRLDFIYKILYIDIFSSSNLQNAI